MRVGRRCAIHATVDSGASVVPELLGPTTGTLSATQQVPLQWRVPGFSRTLGTYAGTITVSWYAAGAGNKPRAIDVQLRVVSDVHRAYLPAIMRLSVLIGRLSLVRAKLPRLACRLDLAGRCQQNFVT